MSYDVRWQTLIYTITTKSRNLFSRRGGGLLQDCLPWHAPREQHYFLLSCMKFINSLIKLRLYMKKHENFMLKGMLPLCLGTKNSSDKKQLGKFLTFPGNYVLHENSSTEKRISYCERLPVMKCGHKPCV